MNILSGLSSAVKSISPAVKEKLKTAALYVVRETLRKQVDKFVKTLEGNPALDNVDLTHDEMVNYIVMVLMGEII